MLLLHWWPYLCNVTGISFDDVTIGLHAHMDREKHEYKQTGKRQKEQRGMYEDSSSISACMYVYVYLQRRNVLLRQNVVKNVCKTQVVPVL